MFLCFKEHVYVYIIVNEFSIEMAKYRKTSGVGRYTEYCNCTRITEEHNKYYKALESLEALVLSPEYSPGFVLWTRVSRDLSHLIVRRYANKLYVRQYF